MFYWGKEYLLFLFQSYVTWIEDDLFISCHIVVPELWDLNWRWPIYQLSHCCSRVMGLELKMAYLSVVTLLFQSYGTWIEDGLFISCHIVVSELWDLNWRWPIYQLSHCCSRVMGLELKMAYLSVVTLLFQSYGTWIEDGLFISCHIVVPELWDLNWRWPIYQLSHCCSRVMGLELKMACLSVVTLLFQSYGTWIEDGLFISCHIVVPELWDLNWRWPVYQLSHCCSRVMGLELKMACLSVVTLLFQSYGTWIEDGLFISCHIVVPELWDLNWRWPVYQLSHCCFRVMGLELKMTYLSVVTLLFQSYGTWIEDGLFISCHIVVPELWDLNWRWPIYQLSHCCSRVMGLELKMAYLSVVTLLFQSYGTWIEDGLFFSCHIVVPELWDLNWRWHIYQLSHCCSRVMGLDLKMACLSVVTLLFQSYGTWIEDGLFISCHIVVPELWNLNWRWPVYQLSHCCSRVMGLELKMACLSVVTL